MQATSLVGRELDLAVALEHLKRIQGGVPTSLLVRGEAGIGKSRLLAEVMARARQLGCTVLVGRADDLDQGMPHAVFRDLLARVSPEPSTVRAEVESFRTALDNTALDSAAPADGLLPGVFASAVRLFRAVAEDAPTMLVLEDMHLADRESLALAAVLIRLGDVPMLTTVSVRPHVDRSRDLEQLLDRMSQDGRGATVDLEPLDPQETRALVAGLLAAVPDDPLAEAVYAASKGNPFFAQETTHSFAEAGGVAVDGGRARLVSGIPAVGLRPSTALLRRLFGGTSTDVELAKVMAVFGRFAVRRLDLVTRLVARSPDEMARAFDGLVKSGLLVRTPDGGYEFAHAIVRDTLYDDIGPAERRRLHGVIAAELGRDGPPGTVLDVLELATHIAESAEPGDEDAAAILLDAGRAVAATAPLVSADYYRRAIELLPASSPRRAMALALQSRSLHIGCRADEASSVGLQALGDLPAGPARAATVAIVVNGRYLGGQVDEALRVIDTELATSPKTSGPPPLLLAEQTNMLFQAGRYAEAAARFPAALAAVRSAPTHELIASAHLIQYANHTGAVDVAAELLDGVTAVAVAGSPTVRLAAHELIAFADWRGGIVARIDRELSAARDLRPEAAATNIGGSFEAARVRLMVMRGQWDDALELIGTAALDLDQRGCLAPAQLLRCAAVEIHIDRGDLDAAAALADGLLTPIEALRRFASLVRARVRRALGDHQEAIELLTEERRRTAAGGSLWKLADVLAELADALRAADRGDEAPAVVAELEQLAAQTGWPESTLPALRARALADRDPAVAVAYVDAAEREDGDLERAHAALVLGEVAADADALARAYKLFDTFGAAPWRRRAAAGLRHLGRTVPRRSAQPRAGLSDTETQLVRLVRDGHSNREIATALHYSTKTIEVYLSRVYAKTGCASRLELIRAVDSGALALDGS